MHSCERPEQPGPLSYRCLSGSPTQNILRGHLNNSCAYLRWKWGAGGDFPGAPVAKNLPGNAGDEGSILGQETKIPHASRQLSPHVTMKFPCATIKTRPSQINMYVHIYIYNEGGDGAWGRLPLTPCCTTSACTLTPIEAWLFRLDFASATHCCVPFSPVLNF